MKPIKSEIEVDGILVPNKWSDDNRIASISLYTSGEREYLIEPDTERGKELVKLLGQRVIVKGTLFPISGHFQKLRVDSYQVFEW